MQDISCSEGLRGEAVEVRRDDSDGSISVSLCIAPNGVCDVDDVLSLLSCWWLRWVAAIDCHFHYDGRAWQVHCHLQMDAHRILPHVLRDLLTIKTAVCS